MGELPEYVDGLPNLCGSEQTVEAAIRAGRDWPVFGGPRSVDLAGIDSAFAVALHMHQPLIPAGGPDLRTAGHHQQPAVHDGEPGHRRQPQRPGVPLVLQADGRVHPPAARPRASSRASCWSTPARCCTGCAQMGLDDVFDALRPLTCDPDLRQAVEWLGCPWGHAVAPSTPVQDYRLHVRAWQHHFAAIFGLEALGRVRGFSPAEMALPNHPDVAYEFVKTLNDCGYQWVLVQEHTVELPDGRSPGAPAPAAPPGRAPLERRDAPRSSPSSRRRAATPSSSRRCSRTTRPRACPAWSSPARACRRSSPRSPTARTAA